MTNYETRYQDIAKPTNVISDGILPAIITQVVIAPLVRYEGLPVGTMQKLWRKNGSVTAAEVTESNRIQVTNSGSRITQTTVTGNATKLAAAAFLTVEAESFTNMDLGKVAGYLGQAIGVAWDAEILALFTGFSTNTVTSASVLTFEDCFEAAYKIRASTKGVGVGQLNAVLGHKGVFELRKQGFSSTAANLSIPDQIQLLKGASAPNGYVGSNGGINFYEKADLATGGGKRRQCVFHPELAFGAMAGSQPIVNIDWLGAHGAAGVGFTTEVSAYLFQDVIEWMDEAGAYLQSAE